MARGDRRHLRQSKASLWATPISCGFFVSVAWLVGHLIPFPSLVYWLIVAMHGLTWLGDALNVLALSRNSQRAE